MRRVVVTGTSGFIGQHLAQALVARGDTVLGIDHRVAARPIDGARFAQCDLRDGAALLAIVAEFSPDAILHLAARTDLDETANLGGYAANTVGVENLIRAIRGAKTVQRCVCTSSQLVCRVGYVPSDEFDYCPTTLYGQSKVLTEKIFRREDGAGVEWCLVRPTTIWGPNMNPHYFRFFKMIRDGRYFHVGNVPALKSYGYIRNTVHQYLKLLDAPAAAIHRQMFFLADYKPIALQDWAEGFRREFGAPKIRTVPVSIAKSAARLGDMAQMVGFSKFPFTSFRLNNVLTPYEVDLRVTRDVCGSLPCSVDQGIAETAAFMRSVWAREESAEASWLTGIRSHFV